MKRIIFQKQQPIFYITLCIALICWLFLFGQILTSYVFTASSKAIPAFLSVTDTHENTSTPSMYSCPVSALGSDTPDSDTIYQFLKQYDRDIRLISCHKEKNYTDIYFYSPILQQNAVSDDNRNFNLQVAITDTKVYFGTPFLQYDF